MILVTVGRCYADNAVTKLKMARLYHDKSRLLCLHGQSQVPPKPKILSPSGILNHCSRHRFNITLPATIMDKAPANVEAHVVWRRSDANPESKAVYLRTAANEAVNCSILRGHSADEVTISFSPVFGQSVYHLYYMAFSTCEFVSLKNFAFICGVDSFFARAQDPYTIHLILPGHAYECCQTANTQP